MKGIVTLCVLLALSGCKSDSVSSIEDKLKTAPIIRVVEEVDLAAKLKTELDNSLYSASSLISSSLPKLLKCANKYPYDDFKYPFIRFGMDSYGMGNEFEGIYFRFEYSPDNNEIKVSFRPEKRYITTTYNLRLGRISVEGHSKETKDAEHWEEMHKQVLVKLYDDLTEICKDNPYANKVTTPEEFEEALERTTRNTIVVTTARWCSPCGYFKNRRLSPFLKKNPHKYDVIFADMDPEFGKTVSDMGGYPIGSNEPLEEHFKKRCDDKGGSLPTVFFFDDKHKHLGTYKEGNDYRFNMNVEKLFGK